MMRMADTLVLVTMILGAAVLIYAVLAQIIHDREKQEERDRQARAEKAAAERAANTRAWYREYREHGVIYPELFPDALDADAERLTRTADLPAFAPRLVPLAAAGSREPDAVYNPGEPLPDEPLPEGEIHPRVAAALAEFAGDAENTFVRNLYTKPLDEIPGLFNRPLALTTGGPG